MNAMELNFDDEEIKVEVEYKHDFSSETFIECLHEQGTDGWKKDRLGVITGTGLQKIITPSGKLSTQADAYMNTLIGQIESGEEEEVWKGSIHSENGKEREPLAAEFYEFITGKKVRSVGFCFKDKNKDVGVSPDRLVSSSGLLEIKCPMASTLIGYRRGGVVPAGYVQQIQGQLWVMGKEWCDFLAWHPKNKHFMVRVQRDEEYIKLMSEAVSTFNEKMLEARKKLGI